MSYILRSVGNNCIRGNENLPPLSFIIDDSFVWVSLVRGQSSLSTQPAVLIANARETCVLSTFLMFSRWKFDSGRIIGNRKAQAGNVIREIIYDTHGKSLYMYNSQGDEFRPKRIISPYRDLCECVSMAIRAHGYRCNYRVPGDNQTVIQRRNKSVRIKIFPLFRVRRDYSRVAN